MNDTLKLPVGIDDFKKIREAGFYYVYQITKLYFVPPLKQTFLGQ